MVVENNYNEYLRKRLRGEDVVSVATLYGFNALASNKTLDSFIVMELNKSDYSYYKYKVQDGKYYVTDYKEEAVSHDITQVLTDELLQNETIMRWWKSVFYESDGICTYDHYYDLYKISDGNEVDFKDIIKNLSERVSALQLPVEGMSHVLLTGELSKNPMLRYVVQEKIGKALVLPETQQTESLNEHDIVALPKEKLLQLSLKATESIKLMKLVDAPINITLPLDSTNGVILSDKTWKDALANEQEDYSVGDLKFKNLNIQVKCDVFQNIFLSCKDLSGNRKVLHLN